MKISRYKNSRQKTSHWKISCWKNSHWKTSRYNTSTIYVLARRNTLPSNTQHTQKMSQYPNISLIEEIKKFLAMI